MKNLTQDYMSCQQNNNRLRVLGILFLTFLCYTSNAQQNIDNLKKTKNGVAVVEVNSDFNSANSVSFLSQLKDCKAFKIDLSNANSLNVKTVPTLIVFDSGKEKHRFNANIMMKNDARFDDVQNAVNEIILNKFQ